MRSQVMVGTFAHAGLNGRLNVTGLHPGQLPRNAPPLLTPARLLFSPSRH
jgi:hypothetical protein